MVVVKAPGSQSPSAHFDWMQVFYQIFTGIVFMSAFLVFKYIMDQRNISRRFRNSRRVILGSCVNGKGKTLSKIVLSIEGRESLIQTVENPTFSQRNF